MDLVLLVFAVFCLFGLNALALSEANYSADRMSDESANSKVTA